jgi:hypothetical protein
MFFIVGKCYEPLYSYTAFKSIISGFEKFLTGTFNHTHIAIIPLRAKSALVCWT